LDALPRCPDEPPDAVVGRSHGNVNEGRELQVREVARWRLLEPLVENIAEAQLVNEDLLDGILSDAFGDRPLVQKSPHRRSVPVVGDELLDLTQIAGVTGVDGAEHDARGKRFLRPPCLADGPRDHHARGLLRAEIEIENQVLDLVRDGKVDRLFRCARIVEFDSGPPLLDPGADLRDRVPGVIGDEDPEGWFDLVISSFHRSDPWRDRRRASEWTADET